MLTKHRWAYLGNDCIEHYIRAFPEEIRILDRRLVMPELEPKTDNPKPIRVEDNYRDYYFIQRKHLSDIEGCMLLLHNSWSPQPYKQFSEQDVVRCNCTLSNVLCEALEIDRSHVKDFMTFAIG